VLLQLGTAVVIIYLFVQTVKLILDFAGKGTKHPNGAVKIELTSDPTVSYRLDKLDQEMKERITRSEHESQRADHVRQLQRIESKLDNIFGVRKLFEEKHDPR
jgi:hypothetical protein